MARYYTLGDSESYFTNQKPMHFLYTRQLFMSHDWENLFVWSVQHKHAHFWKDSYPTLNKEGHISTAYSLIL